MLRNYRYLVKTTVAVNQIFYKLIFFETLIIFLQPTIKLIINDDGTSAFFRCFFRKIPGR